VDAIINWSWAALTSSSDAYSGAVGLNFSWPLVGKDRRTRPGKPCNALCSASINALGFNGALILITTNPLPLPILPSRR